MKKMIMLAFALTLSGSLFGMESDGLTLSGSLFGMESDLGSWIESLPILPKTSQHLNYGRPQCDTSKINQSLIEQGLNADEREGILHAVSNAEYFKNLAKNHPDLVNIANNFGDKCGLPCHKKVTVLHDLVLSHPESKEEYRLILLRRCSPPINYPESFEAAQEAVKDMK